MRSFSLPGIGCGLAVALALAWSSPAGATPSVDLFFTEHNGLPIADATSLAVAPGDQIQIEMRMSTDERGISGYSVSVDFDSADAGRIVLDDFADTLPLGFDFALGADTPWGPEHANGVAGFVKHFTAGTFDPDPITENAVFTIGTLSFTVMPGILDGPATIASGLFFTGVDEILSNELVLEGGDFVFQDVSAFYALNGVVLAAIPEPSPVALLGGGMLVFAAWRRRRLAQGPASG